MEYRVVTLEHGTRPFTAVVDQIQQDRALVAALWRDAEGRPGELLKPGTRLTVTLVTERGLEVPAAFTGARVIDEDGRPVLKSICNYEVRRFRGHGLWEAAHNRQHLDVVEPSGLPGVAYLFGEPPGSDREHGTPIRQFLGHGWTLSGPNGRGEFADHWWWEARRPA